MDKYACTIAALSILVVWLAVFSIRWRRLKKMSREEAIEFVKSNHEKFGKIVRLMTGQKLLEILSIDCYVIRDLDVYFCLFMFYMTTVGVYHTKLCVVIKNEELLTSYLIFFIYILIGVMFFCT